MTWHVITRVGDADDFEPTLANDEPRIHVGLRREGDPERLGADPIKAIAKSVGVASPPMAIDLLSMASAAYAADLRIPRNLGLDRWTRKIRLHVPVSDPAAWTSATPLAEQLLTFLTGDEWTLDLRPLAPIKAPALGAKKLSIPTACLFSGGLDSLIGGVDLLAEGQRVALVGQYGAGMTGAVQDRVLRPLRAAFGGALYPFRFHVQPTKNHSAGEPSMRSRSILFLGLGIAVATALDAKRLVVAENGLISLNVPLTLTRLGSHSTRTTHPHVIVTFTRVLEALNIGVKVELPYRFQTKGEMLVHAKSQDLLREVAPLTMSCSHPEVGRYLGNTPGKHCGYCVPCIIRRAAFNRAGWPHGSYDTDVVRKPPAMESDTSADLRAFKMAIERFRGTTRKDHLAAVLATGPLPPGDAGAYADTYARGIVEVADLFTKRRKQ